MDKIDPAGRPDLLSQQVSGARYFFLDLAPRRRAAPAVALGGREQCNPDYAIDRRRYAYHGLEYVAEGGGTVELAGRRERLAPGTVFAYGPHMHCAIRTDPARPMVKYFVCLAGRGAGRRLARAGVRPGGALALAAHAELREHFDDLIREGRRGGAAARKICAVLLELILLKIADAAARRARRGDAARENFVRCRALIDAQAERLRTLGEIAVAAGMEASSLCRLFRRELGTSPYQYLLRRKMHLAAERLLESGGRVKEAAQRAGFADPYHFSRRFKAVHGVSPRNLLRYGKAR